MDTHIKVYKLGHQQHKLGEESKNVKHFMQLKLSYYKLKIDNYNYKMYYESIMVNIKMKSFIDRQVIKRKEAKYTATNLRRKTAREDKRQRNYKTTTTTK